MQQINYLPVLHLPWNHQGRRGTTADISDNLLPALTVLGRLKSRRACSLMLSLSTSFPWPSHFPFPWCISVLCKILFYGGHLILSDIV